MVQGAREWHDRRVAEAADAWLADAQDVAAYGRLVEAVQGRRASLEPVPDVAGATGPHASTPKATTEDPTAADPTAQHIDELAEQRPPSTLGDVVGGVQDPGAARAALDRLRRGLA